MDAIKAARELGKAIQADERYVRYNEAMKANDADMELQELIGEFNLARQNVALEMSKSKEEQNKEKLDTQNKEMQRLYTLVMQRLIWISCYTRSTALSHCAVTVKIPIPARYRQADAQAHARPAEDATKADQKRIFLLREGQAPPLHCNVKLVNKTERNETLESRKQRRKAHAYDAAVC